MYIQPSSPKERTNPDLESKLLCPGSLSTSRQSPVSIIIRHWVRVVNSSCWSLWTSSKGRLENTLFFLFKSYNDHRCPTYFKLSTKCPAEFSTNPLWFNGIQPTGPAHVAAQQGDVKALREMSQEQLQEAQLNDSSTQVVVISKYFSWNFLY